jgi:hypothetical protein
MDHGTRTEWNSCRPPNSTMPFRPSSQGHEPLIYDLPAASLDLSPAEGSSAKPYFSIKR